MPPVVLPFGVYRGTVTRVAGARAFVTVARMSATREYGPVETLVTPDTPGLQTGVAGADAHSHSTQAPAGYLKAGDRVLVGFIEGRPDDIVVVGRLA